MDITLSTTSVSVLDTTVKSTDTFTVSESPPEEMTPGSILVCNGSCI